jgi:hypothetical protein
MAYNIFGWTHAAHRNVTPTDNALQKKGVSAAENDGFTMSCLLALFRATPLGHGRWAWRVAAFDVAIRTVLPLFLFLPLCPLFSLSLSTLSRWSTRPASHDTVLPGPARPPPRFSINSFKICLALDRLDSIALPILDPLNFLTQFVATPFEPSICPLANLALVCTARYPPLDKPFDS